MVKPTQHVRMPLPGDLPVGGDQGIAHDALAGAKGAFGLASTPADGVGILDEQLPDQDRITKVDDRQAPDQCPWDPILSRAVEQGPMEVW